MYNQHEFQFFHPVHTQIQNKDSTAFSDPNGEPAYARPVKSRTTSGSSNPTSPNMDGSYPLNHHQQQQLQHPPQPQLPPPLPSSSPGMSRVENGQLESMLGDLQFDMNRQGVNTKHKGMCAACSKPIVGQVCLPVCVHIYVCVCLYYVCVFMCM